MTLYECDFCGKQFSSEKGLDKISIVIGDGVRKSEDICSECSREVDLLLNEMKIRRHASPDCRTRA